MYILYMSYIPFHFLKGLFFFFLCHVCLGIGEPKSQVDRISAAAKHLGIDGDVVPFGSYTNTLPGSSEGLHGIFW